MSKPLEEYLEACGEETLKTWLAIEMNRPLQYREGGLIAALEAEIERRTANTSN